MQELHNKTNIYYLLFQIFQIINGEYVKYDVNNINF